MQIVTTSLLDLGLNKEGEINEQQLILLDVKEEMKSQFRELSLGKELSDARAELFVLLANISTKKARETIIKNYKALQKFRQELHKPKEQEQTQTPIQTLVEGDVTIYCDGGCTPNPGKAGSGVAVYRNAKLSELWYGLYEPMGTKTQPNLVLFMSPFF